MEKGDKSISKRDVIKKEKKIDRKISKEFNKNFKKNLEKEKGLSRRFADSFASMFKRNLNKEKSIDLEISKEQDRKFKNNLGREINIDKKISIEYDKKLQEEIKRKEMNLNKKLSIRPPRNFSHRKRNTFLIISIMIILSLALYFTFFFFYTPDDISTFKAYQEKCSRAVFVNQAEDVDWRYRILGREDGKCEIEVTAIKVREGTLDKKSLEGKSMICELNYKSTKYPESDISMCHGLLKEEMQKLIIDNLHKYIVSNLGQISEALNKTSI